MSEEKNNQNEPLNQEKHEPQDWFVNPKVIERNEHKWDSATAEINQNFGQKFLNKFKNFRWKRFFAILIIITTLIMFALSTLLFSSLDKFNSSFGGNGNIFSNVWNAGKNLITGNKVELKGQSEGRTNILVLGLANEGGTDTIILLSYFHKEKKFSALTIPRDFYVQDGYWENGKWVATWKTKINGSYVFANNRESDKTAKEQTPPAKFVADLISREYDIPIHYWTVVNFTGVRDVINLFGGIEVDVENTFTDCEYPNKSYGYLPCQTFKKGLQHMDGDTALIYSRSRHGNNGEGSDFARSKRQTNVIKSLMAKAKENLSNGKGITINNINQYLEVFGNNVKTSMTIEEILSFYQSFKEGSEGVTNFDSIFYRVTWEVGNGFLVSESSDTAGYIITYADGTTAMTANSSSKSRAMAKKQIQNMLEEGKYSTVYSANTVILGNQSDLIDTVYDSMINTGFSKVWDPNSNYKSISKATATSVEKATFYIKDDVLRASFTELAKTKFKFSYEIQKDLPADKNIDSTNASADIVILIESVK